MSIQYSISPPTAFVQPSIIRVHKNTVFIADLINGTNGVLWTMEIKGTNNKTITNQQIPIELPVIYISDGFNLLICVIFVGVVLLVVCMGLSNCWNDVDRDEFDAGFGGNRRVSFYCVLFTL